MSCVKTQSNVTKAGKRATPKLEQKQFYVLRRSILVIILKDVTPSFLLWLSRWLRLLVVFREENGASLIVLRISCELWNSLDRTMLRSRSGQLMQDGFSPSNAVKWHYAWLKGIPDRNSIRPFLTAGYNDLVKLFQWHFFSGEIFKIA